MNIMKFDESLKNIFGEIQPIINFDDQIYLYDLSSIITSF